MADEPAGIESRIAELEAKRERLDEEIGKLVAAKSQSTAESLEDFEAMSATERRELKERAPGFWRKMMNEKRDRAVSRLARTGGSR